MIEFEAKYHFWPMRTGDPPNFLFVSLADKAGMRELHKRGEFFKPHPFTFEPVENRIAKCVKTKALNEHLAHTHTHTHTHSLTHTLTHSHTDI